MARVDAPKFNLGEMVYRRVKPDDCGMVTGIIYRENWCEYFVSFSDEVGERIYQAMELTREKSFAEKPN